MQQEPMENPNSNTQPRLSHQPDQLVPSDMIDDQEQFPLRQPSKKIDRSRDGSGTRPRDLSGGRTRVSQVNNFQGTR